MAAEADHAYDVPRPATRATTENASAKINLCLHVTGQRPDGYHLLDTLVVFADRMVADQIAVTAADRHTAQDTLRVTGLFGDALDDGDQDNLVLQACHWLRAHAKCDGRSTPPVSITLSKALPVASGLGGGSADAAATLRALVSHWQLPDNMIKDQESALAAALGADVPMCLYGKTLRARGIGADIAPTSNLPALPAVLVNPGQPVSTPAVFGALAEKDNAAIPPCPAGFDNAPALAAWLDAHTRNDLQGPAMATTPSIASVLGNLEATGARLARMSGSGATCFGLFDNVKDANTAAEAIANSAPSWWVRATTLNATGARQ